MLKLLEKINNYCLYLLVFSVTFENWDPFKLVGSYSLTYLTSICYILTWIPLLHKNFDIRLLKQYVVPLLLFLLVGLVSTAFHSHYADELKDSYNYRVLLLIVLMILIANHIQKQDSMISRVLNTYVISILLVFLLVTAGMGVSYEKGRLMLFGENPNMLGMKAVIAFLIVLAKTLDNSLSLKGLIISIAFGIPLLSLVVLSGSRGAFLSIFLGLAIMIFFKKTGGIKKIGLIALGGAGAVYLFIYLLQSNEILQRRLTHSIETGDTGRGQLWLGAIQIIEDNLILGVGFPGVLPEMYRYSGRFIDPHNVFLYVLISTGVIGFSFFMLFIFRLLRDQYILYRQSGHTLYIVILIIILMNMTKAGGGIGKILFWFFFAVLIGATVLKAESDTLKIKPHKAL